MVFLLSIVPSLSVYHEWSTALFMHRDFELYLASSSITLRIILKTEVNSSSVVEAHYFSKRAVAKINDSRQNLNPWIA